MLRVLVTLGILALPLNAAITNVGAQSPLHALSTTTGMANRPSPAIDTTSKQKRDSTPAVPKDELAKVIKQVLSEQQSDEVRNRIIKLGGSVGWRHVLYPTGGYKRDASLKPGTDTVRFDEIDRGDVVVSAILAAYPWHRPANDEDCCSHAFLWRLGFIANLDVATLGDAAAINFNRSIEGGLGLGVRLHDNFSLGMTVERIFSRRPRTYIKDGAPLPRPASTIPDLKTSDDRYFISDNLTALSFKFIYFLR